MRMIIRYLSYFIAFSLVVMGCGQSSDNNQQGPRSANVHVSVKKLKASSRIASFTQTKKHPFVTNPTPVVQPLVKNKPVKSKPASNNKPSSNKPSSVTVTKPTTIGKPIVSITKPVPLKKRAGKEQDISDGSAQNNIDSSAQDNSNSSTDTSSASASTSTQVDSTTSSTASAIATTTTSSTPSNSSANTSSVSASSSAQVASATSSTASAIATTTTSSTPSNSSANTSSASASSSAQVTSTTATTTPNSNAAWAHVEGFRLHILRISLLGQNQDVTLADFTQNPNDGIFDVGENTGTYKSAIDINATIPEGTYTGVRIEIQRGYDLKAYGYTDQGTCNTSVSGIECWQGQVDPSNFPDYDFYHYNFLYVSTTDFSQPNNSAILEGGDFIQPIVVNADDPSPVLQLLLDTYRLTTLWDGTGNRPSIAPFNWNNNYNFPISAFFPDSTPNFGISYIPIFASLSDPGETYGEIYVSSWNQDSVNNFDETSHNLSGLQYLTIAFKSTGEYAGSRVVGFDEGELWQFNSSVTVQNDGNLALYNGECCQLANGVTQPTGIQDRQLIGLQVNAPINNTFGALFTNGPDCNSTIILPEHPDWGNRVRSCLNQNEVLYFKRIK